VSAGLTRRAALSGAVASVAVVGVAAAAAVSNPVATSPDPAFRRLMQENDAAERRFCAQPVDLETADYAAFRAEETRMVEASHRADAAVPTNWREFVELFDHMVDDGNSSLTELNVGRLLGHAHRLAKMEG
jgi:predicted lipid carrier protein YhbT